MNSVPINIIHKINTYSNELEYTTNQYIFNVNIRKYTTNKYIFK